MKILCHSTKKSAKWRRLRKTRGKNEVRWKKKNNMPTIRHFNNFFFASSSNFLLLFFFSFSAILLYRLKKREKKSKSSFLKKRRKKEGIFPCMENTFLNSCFIRFVRLFRIVWVISRINCRLTFAAVQRRLRLRWKNKRELLKIWWLFNYFVLMV